MDRNRCAVPMHYSHEVSVIARQREALVLRQVHLQLEQRLKLQESNGPWTSSSATAVSSSTTNMFLTGSTKERQTGDGSTLEKIGRVAAAAVRRIVINDTPMHTDRTPHPVWWEKRHPAI